MLTPLNLTRHPSTITNLILHPNLTRPSLFPVENPPYGIPGDELHLRKAEKGVDDEVPGAFM